MHRSRRFRRRRTIEVFLVVAGVAGRSAIFRSRRFAIERNRGARDSKVFFNINFALEIFGIFREFLALKKFYLNFFFFRGAIARLLTRMSESLMKFIGNLVDALIQKYGRVPAKFALQLVFDVNFICLAFNLKVSYFYLVFRLRTRNLGPRMFRVPISL